MKPSDALLVTLISGISVSLPDTALSDDIKFFVTNNSSKKWCVELDGPALRNASSDPLSPGTQRNNFYTAQSGIFPPYGVWTAYLIRFMTADGEDACDDDFEPDIIDFCLVDRPANEVDITITGEALTINATPPPCNDFVQATAFLGHAPGQDSMPARGRGHPADRDRDVFQFEGDAGDHVIVTLEPDGTRGGTGEHARLVLRDPRGGTLREEAHGPLPSEIAAILPGPGAYEVVVEEQPRSSNPFRGHYQVTWQSTAEVDLALEPLASVEP